MDQSSSRGVEDVKESTPERLGRKVHELALHAVENGVGPVTGSRTYAEDRLSHCSDDRERAIKRLVRESVAASGTAGFVTGLGGFVAMPVTLPASAAGNLVINARMVGGIAHLRGFDLDDPHTQAMLMLTVAGSSAQSVASTLGVTLGQQMAAQAIKNISMDVIRKINRKAGFYLVAKYGSQRSAITLAKGIPLAGGVVGGGVDAALTRGIGAAAKKVFPTSELIALD